MRPVFAYGSNMCSGRFRHYGVHPEGDGRAALLVGYRLVFNKPSSDGSGKANVEADLESRVWGVLYMIPDADVLRLDAGEVGYHRVPLPVCLAGVDIPDVLVYLASATRNDPALRPYTWYKHFLVEGAQEHGLPEEYIQNTLQQIEANEDADRQRDRDKRALV